MWTFYFWQDAEIKDPELVDLMNKIEELEKKLSAHPLHKVLHTCCLYYSFVHLIVQLQEVVTCGLETDTPFFPIFLDDSPKMNINSEVSKEKLK